MTTDVRRSVARTLATITAFAGRVHEGQFPQPPAVPVWPAARFTFVGNTPAPSVCGDTDPDADDFRVQVDICVSAADGTAALSALRRAVILAMQSPVVQAGEDTLPSYRETDLYAYDSETKTHRQILDFVITPSSD